LVLLVLRLNGRTVNAPRQIVIAGSNKGMTKVLEAARKSGARKAVRLDVSEPSHCPLLQPVADTLTRSVQTIHLQEPKMVYVGNVTGRALRSGKAIFGGLSKQHCAWCSLVRCDNDPERIGLSLLSRDASGPCSK
jgi:acyl transferase domain-containing protein